MSIANFEFHCRAPAVEMCDCADRLREVEKWWNRPTSSKIDHLSYVLATVATPFLAEVWANYPFHRVPQKDRQLVEHLAKTLHEEFHPELLAFLFSFSSFVVS